MTENEQEQLTNLMKSGVAKFSYWSNKDNGERIAYGTLFGKMIDQFAPSGETKKASRNPLENVFVYFDMQKKAFRSFHKGRFIRIFDYN